MVKWYERLLLSFKRKQYKIVREGFHEVQITYKTLFNKKIVLKKIELPLRHINCRCSILKVEVPK